MLQRELFAFLEKSTDAVFAVNEEGEICFWSTVAEKLFGRPATKAMHNSCYSLLQARGSLGTPALTRDFYTREIAREPWGIPSFDVEVTISAGLRIWVDLSSLLFEDPRTHQRLIVHLAHDITERKKREELLNSLLQVFKQLKVAASNGGGNGNGRAAPVSPLSDKEQSILQLFWNGKSAPQVAVDQQITLQTLRNHLHHINEKLGTHNRLQAVVHAMHRNLI